MLGFILFCTWTGFLILSALDDSTNLAYGQTKIEGLCNRCKYLGNSVLAGRNISSNPVDFISLVIVEFTFAWILIIESITFCLFTGLKTSCNLDNVSWLTNVELLHNFRRMF